MITGRLFYTIEAFRVAEGDGIERGDELEVSGWFHGEHDAAAITLLLDGATTPRATRLEINGASPDVAGALGPAASHRRFSLSGPAPNMVPFTRAVLRVDLQNGDRHEIDIASLFQGSAAVEAASLRALVMQFESLGDNPELGLLQRQFSGARTGLFQYADCRAIGPLTEAIHDGLEGFITGAGLRFAQHGGAWMVTDHRSGYVLHTGNTKEDEAAIRALLVPHLAEQARSFIDGLVRGTPIYVRRANDGEPEDGMHALFHALRSAGPARLLWVTLADRQNAAGSVRKLADGLFRGYIERLAPYTNPSGFSVAAWTALLTEAEKLIVAPPPASFRVAKAAAPRPDFRAWPLSGVGDAVPAERAAGWRKKLGL